jgi:hypothetical protein
MVYTFSLGILVICTVWGDIHGALFHVPDEDLVVRGVRARARMRVKARGRV